MALLALSRVVIGEVPSVFVPLSQVPVSTPPPTVLLLELIDSEEDRFLDTERCISAKRTFSITCCVPPTTIRFDTRSGA